MNDPSPAPAAATFTIEPAPGVQVVRAGGAIIAESRSALLLRAAGEPPVVYFPRADVGMAFLDRSERETTCPDRGRAAHFHIAAKSGPIADAAWSFEDPAPAVEAIRGHIAFGHDRVTVEGI